MFKALRYVKSLNGSGKQNLYDQKSRELRFAQELRSELCQNYPHGRDYDNPQQLKSDHEEYLKRLNAVDCLIDILDKELNTIADFLD